MKRQCDRTLDRGRRQDRVGEGAGRGCGADDDHPEGPEPGIALDLKVILTPPLYILQVILQTK